jgi:hypothetical protein
MELAILAAMVTYQMLVRPDVSRRELQLLHSQMISVLDVPEKEKSTIRIRLSALSACHTLEPKDQTLSAFQINAPQAKSSHGSEPALTALMDLDQMLTEVAALDHHLLD